MGGILVAGLNPAWQKILELGKLVPGEVNRAIQSWSCASGKGFNAARVLRALGREVDLLQILGGQTGKEIEAACASLGIRSLSLRVGTDTRTCTTLLESAELRSTELIEPFRVQGVSTEHLLEQLDRAGNPEALLLCGTLPDGVPSCIYRDLVHRAGARLSLLDASRNLPDGLLEAVDLLKVNGAEFRQLLTAHPAFFQAAPEGKRIFVTDGPRPAWIFEGRGGIWRETRFLLPSLPLVINPIGAGDTVAAALVDGLLRGREPEAAFCHALALGCASCLEVLPARWDPEVAQSLLPEIRVLPQQRLLRVRDGILLEVSA